MPATPKSRPPRLPLYPYQLRWLGDDARFKIACKARQIGFTFAATFRVVQVRRRRPGLTVWLSASQRQALEAMEYIRQHLRVLGLAARCQDDFIEGTLVKQHQVRLANGSRIVALPANPDTVRGFAGDVVLDEFAFHRDAEAIWRAAFATATRGFQIEIISTPNGARGKYYELAREAGLVDFEPPTNPPGGDDMIPAGRPPRFGLSSRVPTLSRDEGSAVAHGVLLPQGGIRMTASERKTAEPEPAEWFTAPGTSHESWFDSRSPSRAKVEGPATSHGSLWSPHWVDLPTARAQGFVVDVESLRAAIADEDAWQQEYCCRFLAEAAHYIPPELVVAAEHPAATTSLPLTSHELWFDSRSPSRAKVEGPVTSHCFLGVDIGRRRDLTVLWLLEVENELAPADARRFLTRAVLTLDRQPFAQQRRALDALLALRRVAAPLTVGHGFSERSGDPALFAGSPAESTTARSTSLTEGHGFSERSGDPELAEGSRAENEVARSATSEGVWGKPARVSPATPGHLIRRCAIDATGLGAMLAEELQARWGARVEPVTFTQAVKEDLAVRVKRLLEERRVLLPYDPAVRAALNAVKRYVTPAGNIRFDAERTESAAHADHFWALALALLAAEEPGPATEFISTHNRRAFSQAAVF